MDKEELLKKILDLLDKSSIDDIKWILMMIADIKDANWGTRLSSTCNYPLTGDKVKLK